MTQETKTKEKEKEKINLRELSNHQTSNTINTGFWGVRGKTG